MDMILILFQVRCTDLSPGGGLGVSSGDDGTLLVWDTSNGVLRVRFLMFHSLKKWYSYTL